MINIDFFYNNIFKYLNILLYKYHIEINIKFIIADYYGFNKNNILCPNIDNDGDCKIINSYHLFVYDKFFYKLIFHTCDVISIYYVANNITFIRDYYPQKIFFGANKTVDDFSVLLCINDNRYVLIEDSIIEFNFYGKIIKFESTITDDLLLCSKLYSDKKNIYNLSETLYNIIKNNDESKVSLFKNIKIIHN